MDRILRIIMTNIVIMIMMMMRWSGAYLVRKMMIKIVMFHMQTMMIMIIKGTDGNNGEECAVITKVGAAWEW